MITLICTKCKATLEMDDAFAGGVCRCQYCGTIQTVPSHLKQQSARTQTGGKALYSTKAAAGAGLPSSGLDELANVVASSGLADGGLANRRPTPVAEYATPAATAAAGKMPLLIGGGALVAVLVGVIGFLLISRQTTAPAPPPKAPTGPGPTLTKSQGGTQAPSGPHFLDIPIEESKVVYLLDRGQSNLDVLDPLKAAVYESLRSLGTSREFQVLFWTRAPAGGNDKPDPKEFAFPRNDYARATEDRVRECEKRFEDLTTSGRTDLGPVIQEAMRRKPDVIIIATAKGFNLEESVPKQVEKARAGKQVTIHTIDLSSDASGKAVLEAISRQTGGTHRHITSSELRSR